MLVRCLVCGQVLVEYRHRYEKLLNSGKTIKEALDQCGLPTSTPFEQKHQITPPPLCCRANLMTSLNLTETHGMYQRIIKWAEGSNTNANVSTNLKPSSHSKDAKAA
jgi:DNA-directed RNA polymerase subunit N (RpoN/RPB10)